MPCLPYCEVKHDRGQTFEYACASKSMPSFRRGIAKSVFLSSRFEALKYHDRNMKRVDKAATPPSSLPPCLIPALTCAATELGQRRR